MAEQLKPSVGESVPGPSGVSSAASVVPNPLQQQHPQHLSKSQEHFPAGGGDREDGDNDEEYSEGGEEEDDEDEGGGDDLRVDDEGRKKNPYDVLQCAFCWTTARTRWEMKRHVEAIHLGIRQHKCDICGKEFIKAYELRNHVGYHHGGLPRGRTGKNKDIPSESPRKCEICGKILCNEGSLRRHVKEMHVKTKDFTCHLCEYRASSKSLVNRHVRAIHLREKPFSCPHDGCSYASVELKNLRVHINSVHLKRRDVACPHCSYRAANVSIMNGHIQRRHGGVGLLTGKGGHYIPGVGANKQKSATGHVQ